MMGGIIMPGVLTMPRGTHLGSMCRGWTVFIMCVSSAPLTSHVCSLLQSHGHNTPTMIMMLTLLTLLMITDMNNNDVWGQSISALQ